MYRWLQARFPIEETWKKYASETYLAKNLNFYYCFGAIALFVCLNQVVSGLWLALFYTPTPALAFHSIQSIMRDVHFGWLLRYLHAVGASLFFVVLYLHVFRSLLYGSYQKPRELVWLLGVLLLFIIMLEAILGYILPWGQTSYWGAQVMTSLVGAIPWIGETALLWLRGDYSVSGVTLQRFFALHVIAIPLFLLIFIYLHIVALHYVGSNNPDGIDMCKKLDDLGRPVDGIAFYPYYFKKDLIAVFIFICVFLSMVFFIPTGAGLILEPGNASVANPLLTPNEIHPAWYVLPFYEMLRVVPSRGWGVVLMTGALIILFFVPWLDKSPVRSMRYKGICSQSALVLFIVSFVSLGVLGMQELTGFTIVLARACMLGYFAYFLLMPVYTSFESVKMP